MKKGSTIKIGSDELSLLLVFLKILGFAKKKTETSPVELEDIQEVTIPKSDWNVVPLPIEEQTEEAFTVVEPVLLFEEPPNPVKTSVPTVIKTSVSEPTITPTRKYTLSDF